MFMCTMFGVAYQAYAADVQANPLEKPGWKLDFHDEFNGPKLDEKVWLPYYLPHLTTTERAAADYIFRDGAIVLKVEEDMPLYRDDWTGWWVSSIQTFEKNGLHGAVDDGSDQPLFDGYTTQYGYFEIRAKMPRGNGGHIAWWMIGTQRTPNESGEVDILENTFWGTDRTFTTTVPWKDTKLFWEHSRAPYGKDVGNHPGKLR